MHHLGRLVRERLSRVLVLLVERDRGTDSEGVHGHGGNPGRPRSPRHGLDDRVRLASLSRPPEPGCEHHLRPHRPQWVGRGRRFERTTPVSDRAGEVAAQQSQIGREQRKRPVRLLAVTHARWRALSQPEPALGLIELA